MLSINLAIVGATGEVGRTIIKILEERKFRFNQLFLLASARSAGSSIIIDKKSYPVQDIATFDFSQADIALFSAGSAVSKHYAPLAATNGCLVIDNTSCFRYEPDIPLVISEVNPEDIPQCKTRGIIANPNCSTMQMLVALKPLHLAAKIKRIQVCTYQSVSGAGKKGIDELLKQTHHYLDNKSLEESHVHDKHIAFNVVPKIDEWIDNGYTKEEMKMIWETHKIFHDDSIIVQPTCVRVPVLYGHSEAVYIETEKALSIEKSKALLQNAHGVRLIEDAQDYPTATTHASGTDPVYVGRLRRDIFVNNGLHLWIVADNVRKGAALNAVQIAEKCLEIIPWRTHAQ